MKKILYMVLIAVLLVSCYKDKSSDVYTPIGSITVTGMEAEYSRTAFIERLQIPVKVTSTVADEKFSYTWTIFESGSIISATYPIPDTISTEQALDFEIKLEPGTYTVALCVTNEANNYKQVYSSKLFVGTPFSTGHYFLKATADGNTEMDFRDATGDMHYNQLKTQLGASMKGSPVRISIAKSYPYIDPVTAAIKKGSVIMPTSTEDCKLISMNNLSLIFNHKDMFYGDVPKEIPYAIVSNISSYAVFVTSNGQYQSSSGKFGFPIKPAGTVSISRHFMVMGSWDGYPITCSLYDDANGLFLKTNYNGELVEHNDDNGNASSNIPHKLLYMGNRLAFSASGYAIFESKTTPTERYIYTVDATGTNSIQSIETLDPSLNFTRATIYTTNKDNPLMYGVVDGTKIYMYNTSSKVETLLQPAGIGAGEEITMITHKNGINTYLYIATHKAGKYKVYMYNISGGVPDGEAEITVEGEGKVVDVQHTNTSQGYINL